MKALITLILLLNTLFATTTIKLVGDKGYPPYSYIDGATPKGVYVDILKSAFDKLPNYKLDIEMVAWKKAQVLVQKNKVDGFFPPYPNEERTKWTEFSAPILKESIVVFAKESTLKDKKEFPKDYYGLTLCVNRSFSVLNLGGEALVEALKEQKIKLKEASDNSRCLDQLSKDKVDFYLNDQLIHINEYKNIKRGQVTFENYGHVGFKLKREDSLYLDEFIKEFNLVIKKMQEDREIDEILNRYIK